MRPANKNIAIAYLRPFIASAMIAGGLANLAAPIYAATAAGSDISNTATASYEDPNTPGVPSYTVSNTVKVSVEKIAGITITGDGSNDVTGTGNKPGDTVNFNFTITNKGNSAAKFSIPGQADVSTAGTFQKVQWLTPGADPTLAASWNDVPTGSATDPALMPIVPVDGSIKARVVVVVRGTASTGDALTVQLGKTAQAPTILNPSIPNVQRTASPETADAGDVYTVDITDGVTIDPSTGATIPAGPAVNSVREAAALVSVSVNKDKKAFADITMTGSAPVADPLFPGDITKEKITYDIKLNVSPTSPDPTLNPSNLGAAPLTLDGNPDNRVLISDPVPTGTTPTSLVAPAGWTPVYSTSPTGTPPVWVSVTAANPLPTTGVTSVGFVKNDSQSLPMSATPYSGFKVVVETTSASTTAPTTYSNIADVFGTTPLPSGLADPTKPIHDQTGTAGFDTPTGGTPVVTNTSPVVAISVFNGPKDKPEAAGPDGTQNTDFTNKSAEIKVTDATVTDPATGALTPLSTPLPVSFNNTVENKGTMATDIYILPTPPATATDLPTNTVVSVSYGSETRTYLYDGAQYVPSAADAAKLPLSIPAVAPNGGKVTYGMSVTLPAGTPQLKAYSAPITAFADTTAPLPGTVTVPTTPTVSSNISINNVYTGFVKLVKSARILNTAADANAPDSGATAFTTGTLVAKPKPGQFIQYRIKYNNISTGNGNSGIDNGLLNAGKLNIVEDGVMSPTNTNNWASNTDHSTGSAIDSKGGQITFFGGTVNDNTDTAVKKYVVDMGATNVVVAPGETGNFMFIRQVK